MNILSENRRLRFEPYLGVLALTALLLGCVYVLKPFMTALMWAIILTYTLYPLQRLFTKWFRGSRTLAACLVTLTVIVLLAGPVVVIGVSLAEDGKELTNATRKWLMAAPSAAPTWVKQMPLVGDEIAGYWSGIASDRDRWIAQLDKEVKNAPRAKIINENGEPQEAAPAPPAVAPAINQEGLASSQIVAMLGKFIIWARSGLIAVGLAVGQGITQVLLSAFLAFFLLRDASKLGERLGVAAKNIAGHRGKRLIDVAGSTVKGVIYGILGTAIAQAVAAGIGFWIAGVPGAVLLALLTFFLSAVPVGPPLIWVPATLWLFSESRTGWAIFLALWGLFVISSVDNFLRPYLISQGSKMPFVLIFCGVIGGAFAFGLVGVFLGPTLLAVAFRLIEEWSSAPEVFTERDEIENASQVLPPFDVQLSK
ncbi:MAG: AI-2E family transporter [Verrucomicrobia bacterium]|nr:MAG: AI-2E family transporter [Verrucomicrobiota bacterium]